MVQILPQQPGLAELLGQGLGMGVQTGIQNILQQRLAQQKGVTPMTPYQEIQTRLREKELEQKERFQEEKTSEWEYLQHKDFRKEVSSNYREALETDMRLNRMQELNEGGNLTAPITAVLLNKLDIPVSVLNNPDSEEFDKLSKDMLKNIRTYFGARINVVEVENFLKTIPTLMNSQEGRRRIINNLKLLLEPRKLMFEEYRKIRQESLDTGKKMPVDLEERVLEGIKPQLDELAKTFASGPSQLIGPNIAPQTQEFEKMPAAADYSGVTIEDDKGNRYRSDGKRWRKL